MMIFLINGEFEAKDILKKRERKIC